MGSSSLWWLNQDTHSRVASSTDSLVRPPVGMIDQCAIALGLPGIKRLLQGIQNEVRVHGAADPPAHDAPSVHVDHKGHV